MFKVHAEHIKFKFQKCPCCFELTKTQFRKCKHNICVPCASRVVEKCNCEDEDCNDCHVLARSEYNGVSASTSASAK